MPSLFFLAPPKPRLFVMGLKVLLMKTLNVGLIGYGFMGRAHSNAFRKVNNFFDLEYRPVLKAVCARDQAKVKAFAEKWGYESYETDWRKLVARDDIALIDIACPNDMHKEIAIAAAKAGKRILCEKPLALDGVEGLKMVQAVEKAGVPNMVWYNYRRAPAVTLAKQLIDEGRLGRIFHYRAKFLQDWTISKDLPQGGAGLWRLDVKVAGSGVTGDLLATFESTRYARGHKALYTFEINGEHASIFWDLHDLHRLQYFDHRDEGRVRGWRSIHVSDSDHPYMGKWWVPGLQIGYEHSFVHQVADFLDGLAKGKPAQPDFRDALRTQFVCDAVLQSAKDQKWVNVAQS